jgi:hypothetical protein
MYSPITPEGRQGQANYVGKMELGGKGGRGELPPLLVPRTAPADATSRTQISPDQTRTQMQS